MVAMVAMTVNGETVLPIRRARPDDAAALSALAIRTFEDTFGPYTAPEDMTAYMSEAYTADRQRAEILDSKNTIFVVEAVASGAEPVLMAYAYVSRSTPPACVTGVDPIELKRLYVDKPWHGQGVAHRLMDESIAAAKALGGQTMWLSVWERNFRAQAFYRRYGFERVGEHIFAVGKDPQVDWLMARSLAPAKPAY